MFSSPIQYGIVNNKFQLMDLPVNFSLRNCLIGFTDILYAAAAAAKSLQSCLTLCDPIDSSPPGSPVPGILQARTLEWFAISFSNSWKWKVKWKSLSRVQLSATPWTTAHQAPPSMRFSRQEYWSAVPGPSPDILYRCIKKKNLWIKIKITDCSSEDHRCHSMAWLRNLETLKHLFAETWVSRWFSEF